MAPKITLQIICNTKFTPFELGLPEPLELNIPRYLAFHLTTPSSLPLVPNRSMFPNSAPCPLCPRFLPGR